MEATMRQLVFGAVKRELRRPAGKLVGYRDMKLKLKMSYNLDISSLGWLEMLFCLFILVLTFGEAQSPLPNRAARAGIPNIGGILGAVDRQLVLTQNRFRENGDRGRAATGIVAIIRNVNRISHLCNQQAANDVIDALERLLSMFTEPLVAQNQIGPTLRRSGRRRVTEIEISLLVETGLSISKIARLLSVNRRTIQRKMKLFGISGKQYSEISDEDLTDHIRVISQNFPNSGYREVTHLLRQASTGTKLIVPYNRVGRILADVDPVGTASRWALAIRRRSYYVPSPNHLWHIDTHHSLIRWRFVITAAVDGYSRLITYLQCNTNNLALTSLNCFLSGVLKYGLPSHTRADKGGELSFIKQFVEAVLGATGGRFITGRSVHNQRIERSWRDVFMKVAHKYYSVFSILEDSGVLNIDNDAHIAALHCVYLNRINEDLNIWCAVHNNHPLRTESNMSPHQLFVTGMLNNINTQSTAVLNFFSSNAIDALCEEHLQDLGLNVNNQHVGGVAVPSVNVALLPNQIDEINALLLDRNDDLHGVESYRNVLSYIERIV